MTPKDILKMELLWIPDPDKVHFFITTGFNKDEVWLRMNDFPDEPMWTLNIRGKHFDFDDTPKLWKINYRSG